MNADNKKTTEEFGPLTTLSAIGALAGTFLLSAAGLGLARTIAPVSEAAAVRISAAASGPWNKLIAS